MGHPIHLKVRRVFQPILLGLGLGIGLLITLVACQTTQADESPLPTL